MEQIYPYTQVSIYTFGSPRTGNQAWSDYVYRSMGPGGYQRVTHYNDAVPHLPPRNKLGIKYNHAGDEVWYKNYGADLTYKICKY